MSDDWSDGSNGYAWKSRNLDEKRSLALEYLGDVKKRVPIHDAVRMRSDLNRRSLQKASDSVSPFFSEHLEESEPFDGSTFDPSQSVTAELESVLHRLLLSEFTGDDFLHVNRSDSGLLKDEFLGNGAEQAESMKQWLKLRRETADYHSYSSIPETERNDWSAWYLRNIRSDPDGDQ